MFVLAVLILVSLILNVIKIFRNTNFNIDFFIILFASLFFVGELFSKVSIVTNIRNFVYLLICLVPILNIKFSTYFNKKTIAFFALFVFSVLSFATPSASKNKSVATNGSNDSSVEYSSESIEDESSKEEASESTSETIALDESNLQSYADFLNRLKINIENVKRSDNGILVFKISDIDLYSKKAPQKVAEKILAIYQNLKSNSSLDNGFSIYINQNNSSFEMTYSKSNIEYNESNLLETAKKSPLEFLNTADNYYIDPLIANKNHNFWLGRKFTTSENIVKRGKQKDGIWSYEYILETFN